MDRESTEKYTHIFDVPAGHRLVRVDKLLECMVHTFPYPNICSRQATRSVSISGHRQLYMHCVMLDPSRKNRESTNYYNNVLLYHLIWSCRKRDFMWEPTKPWALNLVINIVIDTKSSVLNTQHIKMHDRITPLESFVQEQKEMFSPLHTHTHKHSQREKRLFNKNAQRNVGIALKVTIKSEDIPTQFVISFDCSDSTQRVNRFVFITNQLIC